MIIIRLITIIIVKPERIYTRPNMGFILELKMITD